MGYFDKDGNYIVDEDYNILCEEYMFNYTEDQTFYIPDIGQPVPGNSKFTKRINARCAQEMTT